MVTLHEVHQDDVGVFIYDSFTIRSSSSSSLSCKFASNMLYQTFYGIHHRLGKLSFCDMLTKSLL